LPNDSTGGKVRMGKIVVRLKSILPNVGRGKMGGLVLVV